MRDDQRIFLTLLAHPPARLNVEQVAWALNFPVHDIPHLVSVGLLKPLGNPPRSGTKFFGTFEILDLAKDPKFLAKATSAIYAKWHKKNKRQPPSRGTNSDESGEQ